MSIPPNPSREYPSTYFVQDRANQTELQRLLIQDHMLTASMGGIFPEQPDPSAFRRVLDIGCGPGGWLLEAAHAYPALSLVGIDISQSMIDYARAQAEAQQVQQQVEFQVMDALLVLAFPSRHFDLVNLRLGSSFMRTWDWPKLLSEMTRVARPRGIIRITDMEVEAQSTSPALTRLYECFECALYRSGHLFTQEPDGLTAHLQRLLIQASCQEVKTKSYALEYRAGTPQGESCYEDAKHIFSTLRPFIHKWGCAGETYDQLYQQMLHEMQQPDFHGTWKLLTAWGIRPPTQEKANTIMRDR
ncbi:MAG TPA: methyltransferase domain-containing protein [Ktedonobacteraceae bacterium]|nr:methyltransferase domain-containing protein [Ktedonobacteraceae bacterium]